MSFDGVKWTKEHVVALIPPIVDFLILLLLLFRPFIRLFSYCHCCVHCSRCAELFLPDLIDSNSILSLFDHLLPCCSINDSLFLATNRKDSSICWPDRSISLYECFSDFGLLACKFSFPSQEVLYLTGKADLFICLSSKLKPNILTKK